MPYIPDDYLVDINNRDQVFEILSNFTDVIIYGSKVPKDICRELERIGEIKLSKMIKEGIITLD